MKTAVYTMLALAIASLGSGCVNLERSRDIGNPNVSGRTLALQVCSSCHGVDGNSTSPAFPKLAGQQEAYLIAQLKFFRGHNHIDPAGSEYMWGITRKLTDEQIEGLARYFSQQKDAPNVAGIPQRLRPERRFSRTASLTRGGRLRGLPWCDGHGQGHLPAPGGSACQLHDEAAAYPVGDQPASRRRDDEALVHGLTSTDLVAVTTYLQSILPQ